MNLQKNLFASLTLLVFIVSAANTAVCTIPSEETKSVDSDENTLSKEYFDIYFREVDIITAAKEERLKAS